MPLFHVTKVEQQNKSIVITVTDEEVTKWVAEYGGPPHQAIRAAIVNEDLEVPNCDDDWDPGYSYSDYEVALAPSS